VFYPAGLRVRADLRGVSGFVPRIAAESIRDFHAQASPRWAAGLANRLATVAGNRAPHVDLVVAVSLRLQARARAGLQTERPDRPPGEAAGAVLLMPARPGPDKRTLEAPRSAGSRSVALLPRVRAAKLTIYASYW
jgi:hypothetical protein